MDVPFCLKVTQSNGVLAWSEQTDGSTSQHPTDPAESDIVQGDQKVKIKNTSEKSTSNCQGRDKNSGQNGDKT